MKKTVKNYIKQRKPYQKLLNCGLSFEACKKLEVLARMVGQKEQFDKLLLK